MNKKNQALKESALKVVFSQVPFAGQLLSEIFFDYRSRIKQERLNLFLENFIKYLTVNSLSEKADSLLSSEDFGDLFESVIRRLVQTNIKERVQLFQNVLTNYIQQPNKNEYQDIFLDIIDRINASQIRVLEAHANINEDIRKLLEQREYFTSEINRLNNEMKAENRMMENGGPDFRYYEITKEIMGISQHLKTVGQGIDSDEKVRNPDFYGISQGEYLFLIQDLFAKGLLMDIGSGTFDTKPFEKMKITEFGKAFLEFIRRWETSENCV